MLGINLRDLLAAEQAGGLSAIKNVGSSVITEQDLVCLNNYNDALRQGVNPMSAYYKTMMGASDAAKDLVTNAHNAEVNVEGLTVGVNNSKLAMIGARIATVALQAAISFGLAFAIQAVITLFQKLKDIIPTVENTAKWLKDSSTELKEIQDKIESLNTELNTTKQRIDELLRKDHLSIVESAELNKLKAYNAELERQIALQEAELKTTKGKNERNFVSSVNAIFNETNPVAGGGAYFSNRDEFKIMMGEYLHPTNENTKDIAKKWLDEFIPRLNEAIESISDYEYDSLSDEAKKAYDEVMDVQNAYLAATEGSFDTVFKSIFNQARFAEGKEALENAAKDGLTAKEVENLYNNNDSVKAMIDNMKDVGLINGITADTFSELATQIEVANQAVGTIAANEKVSFSDLISNENIQNTIDGFKTKLTTLSEALEDLRNGDLSDSDMIDLFKEFPELANHTDDLDVAINELIDSTQTEIGNQFEEWQKNMPTEEDSAALNNVYNALKNIRGELTNDDIDSFREKLNHIKTKESCENIDELTEKMKSYADEYNKLVGYGKNGNVDYNRRPVISADDVKVKYPEFDGDYATTYDQGYRVSDSNGKGYAITVTPILENGEILSQEELDSYVDNIINGSDNILEADTKNIIIHAEAEGEGDYWITNPDGSLEFDWERFNDQLIPAKEGHLEAYLTINSNVDELIPYAEKLGITVEQLIAIGDIPSILFDTAKQTSDKINELNSELDNLKNTYDDIADIIDNYNDNGYYTLDNLKSLLELEPEYINVLIDENGQINLNSQAYRDYASAKAKMLVVDQIKSLYETILAMSSEEVQAYANAEAYDTETKSLNDLISATTSYYLVLARAKDAQNNTTAYTDGLKQSFKTVANYAAIYDSWLNSLSGSNNEFSTTANETKAALEAQKKSLQSSKDALEDYKDSLENTKDALEDYKDSLSDAKDNLQDLIDLTTDYIKQLKEDEKDALEEQKDNFDDIIAKKKEALELAKEEREEADKLADKQNAVAKDKLALAIAQLDDSSAGKKAQKQTADSLASSQKDLSDYLYEKEYNARIAALEAEQEAFDNSIDEQIKKIDEYLDNARQLYEDACSMIDNDTGDLYGKLWGYTYKYTTQTRAEFDNLWNNAQEAIRRYKGDNDTLIGTMESLQRKIYDTDKQIDDLNTQIDNCESQMSNLDDAINATSDAISNTSSSIDSVSSSLDGLGASIASYIEQLNGLADVNVNNDNNGTTFWVSHNGKKYWTDKKYNGDTKSNRLLAAAELTKKIAQDVSGFDQYGLGIIQGYLGVGNGNVKQWYYDFQGKRYTAVSAKKENAISQIIRQIESDYGTYPASAATIYGQIKHYSGGTRNSASLAITQENGLEAIFGKLSSGQYTMMPQGSQVFTAVQTDNLYGFASDPQKFISDVIGKMSSFLSSSYGNFADSARGVTNKVTKYGGDVTMNFAPVTNIQGNADKTTISQMDKLYEKFKNRFMLEMLREKNNL